MKTVFNIVLVLCAAALIYICYSSIMGPINFEKAKKERLIRNAFESSKKEVKLQLKSPSTAKFATELDEESKYKINDDNSVIIRSYVDAQNSFGATVRTHFQCTVDKYGNIKDLTTW